MRLGAYLEQENLSPAAFGRLCDPEIPRSTIWQWSEGTRFPQDPLDIQEIERVTAGKVTAADFVGHAAEVRGAAGARRKSKRDAA